MTTYQKDAAVLFLLCILAVLCWLPRLKGPIDLRFDGGAYYILGTSLAEGKGYRLLNEPGDINSTLHPPLLPAIVAAHQLLLGTSDPVIVGQWLRIFFFLSFLVYIFAVYLMFRLFWTLTYAVLATLVCLLHLNTQFLSDLLFAELLFALTTTLFYICHKRSGKKGYALLTILLALSSYALRTVGVALFAAWVGESLLKKDFKGALFRLTLSLLPIICWQSYIYTVESGPQYQSPAYEYQRADYMYSNVSYVRNSSLIDPFAPEKGYITSIGRIRRFGGNVLRMPAKLGVAVSTVEGYWESHLMRLSNGLRLSLPSWVISWLVFFALSILGFLVIGGVILQVIKRQWFTPLYVLTYLLLICLTPWAGQFSRYLMPLAPFLILSLFETFLFIKTKDYKVLFPKYKFAGGVFSASVLFLILLVQAITVYAIYSHDLLPVTYYDKRERKVEYRQFFYLKPYQSLDEALDWLMVQGKPGYVVAGAWPQWIYLRTGLKAVLPPLELDAEKAQHLLDTVPVKYLMLEKDDFLGTTKYVSSVLQNSQGRWKLVFSTADGRLEIYEREN
jgi:4-amino-4-deoxy-L-arabinose transferase-like glycosyltransferase